MSRTLKPKISRDHHILIRGARTHNLKNIDVDLPKQKLIVVTGVSGSGKSSLAFDTIYAEGQRRYVESLSTYARQFLERMEKPNVDKIEGICPAIAIRQKSTLRNPRSTVGTTTEIHDYLRLMFARIGRTFCRKCGKEIFRDPAEVAAKELAALPEGTRLLLGFEMPIIQGPVSVSNIDLADTADVIRKSKHTSPQSLKEKKSNIAHSTQSTSATAAAIDSLRRKGFNRIVLNDQVVSFDNVDIGQLEGTSTFRVLVDRIKTKPNLLSRLTGSVETAYLEGGGSAFAIEMSSNSSEAKEQRVHKFSERFECRKCDIHYELPQPRLFSFNSPFGACSKCHGFGNVVELDMDLVVPDQSKSIQQDAIDPWNKPHYKKHLAKLKKIARLAKIRLNQPWSELSKQEREFVIEGNNDDYDGIKGFFRSLERKKYKVQVRVFLSRYRSYFTCPQCKGARLRQEALDVLVGGLTINQVCGLTVADTGDFFGNLELTNEESIIGNRIVDEIKRRLKFLSDVGLGYLTLDRLSSTLSGGETQRINLATSLGSSLVGTLYVLDEPSIGLHPRDNERLLKILKKLRDQGNTVLVVEHDADMIRSGDYLIDLGVGAGTSGGKVVYAGPASGITKEQTSLTAKYLRGELAISVPTHRSKRLPHTQVLRVRGASEHNLKKIDVEIPINMLTCVTGVSGSGKSTLVRDVLYAAVKQAKGEWGKRVGAHESLDGLELINNIVLVDQAPIGRTPRSNPVTYLKGFDPIRELFASTRGARTRGLKASHFSFNVPGGRCDVCEGEGQIRVDMQFLADVFVPCERCDGKRFKSEVLDVEYRGLSIDRVLALTVSEALSFFSASPKVLRRLQVLNEIGLGYLGLGQPATTLSGGEAQRIKIASHLSSHKGERTLYILDEPTTGLHFDDIARLLVGFRKLLSVGHTLVVIEHNLDVIKTADWIIDLGPEGGNEGGQVVGVGPPEMIAENKRSHTGRYLRQVLKK